MRNDNRIPRHLVSDEEAAMEALVVGASRHSERSVLHKAGADVAKAFRRYRSQ